MALLEYLFTTPTGIMFLIIGILIIKAITWMLLYSLIKDIVYIQNKEIIKNQKEIIKLLGGKVEEEPEEVDKLKYL